MADIPGSISKAASALLDLETSSATGAPVAFLDVAAGPGILSMYVFERMKASKLPGRITVTDFAPGMVDAARGRFASVEAETKASGVDVSFEVMDGQALAVADRSMTHVGCMFGIMFYPDRPKGLRELHRVLVPGGRAVVATWMSAGAGDIAADFAAYLGLPPLGSADPNDTSPGAAVRRMSEVGKDPDVLASELRAAGFESVGVHQVPTRFVSAEWAPFLAMLRSNPALGQFFTAAPADTDWDGAWRKFLGPGGPGAEKYCPNGTDLDVKWVANVAVATA